MAQLGEGMAALELTDIFIAKKITGKQKLARLATHAASRFLRPGAGLLARIVE
ncbi:hypothetical protein BAG01nite_08090 [Brevibacillus agri]|uniref:Uncharacterized protein n=1 Tax=Brevibacillus agri TaxID=51101 RepID=A0ABQ0SLJ9_9BACL|nr:MULTISPECIES: hypothetical protein [Brevibacillus]ELK40569.1 hypothetical protein D478_18711 [Brevibacillus agri BAB-2500]EJL45860.1 hypothetical protein PMI08_01493 [Brevibacillus sp. CF112]MBY0051631.1 hypothetical protein [Brevibacillus agri]MCG5252369.1 hypothetical protein [Brevibacillus agri]MDN4091331.1 hypothetical protein [Brevibacillus agri]